MATTTNPFEPPRTTDLDGTAGGDPARVSPAALRELVVAAPWVRRLVRLSALTIALQLIVFIVDLARGRRVGAITLIVVASIAIAILFLRILRWYDAASERLRRGDANAIGALVDAMASYFKLAGVLVAMVTGAYVLYLAYGIATGRWLSWMRA
jgi:hypothetical protein